MFRIAAFSTSALALSISAAAAATGVVETPQIAEQLLQHGHFLTAGGCLALDKGHLFAVFEAVALDLFDAVVLVERDRQDLLIDEFRG